MEGDDFCCNRQREQPKEVEEFFKTVVSLVFLIVVSPVLSFYV